MHRNECLCNNRQTIRKVRIGKDIGIHLTIETAEGEKVEDIKEEITFELIDPKGGKTEITEYTIVSDNEVEFGLDGKQFKWLGPYILTTWRNHNTDKPQTCIDEVFAFELVRFTDHETTVNYIDKP